jgi:hypothetical protein
LKIYSWPLNRLTARKRLRWINIFFLKPYGIFFGV